MLAKSALVLSLAAFISLWTVKGVEAQTQNPNAMGGKPIIETRINKMPSLKLKEDKEKKAAVAEKKDEPKYHWYYDYRESQQYCLTRQEAAKRRLGSTHRIEACTLRDRT